MSDAIVRIVRREIDASKNRTGMQAGLRKVIIDTSHAEYLCKLAERLEAENERLREELRWYGEQAKLARLIHSEGDAGRNALAADGGKRAREALATKPGGRVMSERQCPTRADLSSKRERELEKENYALKRMREKYDCRFAGDYAEMSGKHCPIGDPCLRCRLEDINDDKEWHPIETAPKDGRTIIGWCEHEADPYVEECGRRLTDYGANAEGMSHVDDGVNLIHWHDSFYEGEYAIPAWWCLADGYGETAANPTYWMPMPEPPHKQNVLWRVAAERNKEKIEEDN